MTPVANAGVKVAAALEWQTDRVRRWRRRVLRRRRAEDIHRLRVALRRLRVAIRLARMVIHLPPDASEGTAGAAASSLGKVRDSAVARAALLELRLTTRGNDAVTIERLVSRVERRERGRFDRARQWLRRGRVRRLLLGLRRILRRPLVRPLGSQPLPEARATLLAPAWAAVVDHPAWALPAGVDDFPVGPDRLRHDLRIRIKELRDTLELLAETPTADRLLIDELNALSTILGEIRDLVKLRAHLGDSAPSLRRTVTSRLDRAAGRWDTLRGEWLAGSVVRAGLPAVGGSIPNHGS